MIQFKLTPVSGVIVLNGKYLYDKSLSEDEYRQEIVEFQIELSWDSDRLMGTRVKRIIFLDPIPDDMAAKAKEKIEQAYHKLYKKPTVLMVDSEK